MTVVQDLEIYSGPRVCWSWLIPAPESQLLHVQKCCELVVKDSFYLKIYIDYNEINSIKNEGSKDPKTCHVLITLLYFTVICALDIIYDLRYLYS